MFEWDPVVPLDVDPTIELPQKDIRNYTSDCTQVYSTDERWWWWCIVDSVGLCGGGSGGLVTVVVVVVW